jgi:predicted MPP superfamily phosphohydrolase
MMVSQFQNIRPPMGSYAVFGNHEYYVGFEHSQEMLRKAGFSVLRGETVTSGPIAIAGADDLSAMRLNLYRKLPPQSSTVFTLLLKHQPIVSSDTPFDLQLSGHVHKGQIFPFNLVTWLRFHIKCGLTTLVDGRQIYVSRGTGTWGPPIRFLAPPEITVIDLVSN